MENWSDQYPEILSVRRSTPENSPQGEHEAVSTIPAWNMKVAKLFPIFRQGKWVTPEETITEVHSLDVSDDREEFSLHLAETIGVRIFKPEIVKVVELFNLTRNLRLTCRSFMHWVNSRWTQGERRSPSWYCWLRGPGSGPRQQGWGSRPPRGRVWSRSSPSEKKQLLGSNIWKCKSAHLGHWYR